MRFAAAFLLLSFMPALLYAQGSATIVGRVVEFGGRSGIVGATISSPGLRQMITGSDGRFTAERVPRGARRFTIAAPGYHTRELAVDVQHDTVLVIELEPQPIQLESLTVRARTVTVRGRLAEEGTGEAVFDGEVVIAGNRTGYSNLIGSFKITNVAASVPTTIQVRAVGYLPLELRLTVEHDTTLSLALTRDPLAQRMLDEEARRLQVRGNSLGFRMTTWNREELERHRMLTVAELLKMRFRVSNPACVIVNDSDRSAVGAEVLRSYLADELDRIEVIDRGTMVRLYTRRYISKLVGREKLPPAMLVKAYRIVCM